MYKLPLILLFSVLTALAVRASVVIPSVYVQNYTVDDYHASCQNWDIAISYTGFLYVANNSGLLTFDGNTWTTYELPDKSVITQVTFLNDTVYTQGESTLGYWTRDDLGGMKYTPLDKLPSSVGFDRPKANYLLPDEIIKASPSAYATTGELNFTGTTTDGLFITDPEGLILLHLSLQNQLQDNIVRSICIQDSGQIWVAFDNGISLIALDPPISLIGKRSFIGKLINASLHKETVYIHTNIGYFKRTLAADDKFQPVSEEEATQFLVTNTENKHLTVKDLFKNTDGLGVFAHADQIYPAPGNLYWLTVGNEAGLFHQEEGEGSLKCRILFDNYNMNIVTRGEQIIPLNDFLYLISSMQGILMVDTRKLIESSLGTGVLFRLTHLEYYDKEGIHLLPLTSQQVSLPYDFQELVVRVGTTVCTPNHQISYKIEGVSSDWSPWQKDGTISLLQLPAGSYELKIRKYAVKGPFPEFTLPIEVRPAWYNTVWAYLIYITLVWLGVQRGLHYHLKRLRKEEQDAQEAERQKEQEKVHQLRSEILEAELQNKNNELLLQTSSLVKKNQVMQSLLEELERQKETLGERYPNKLYTRMRTLMEETLNDQDSWAVFENYFNNAHQNFMERLRREYDDITTGDLRICCLLRMNLSTKEIASLLNVSIRAVELRRYRLRKRLSLDADINLVDFLIRF